MNYTNVICPVGLPKTSEKCKMLKEQQTLATAVKFCSIGFTAVAVNHQSSLHFHRVAE